MSKEIELRFFSFDRKILNEKIKELGGVKKGMYHFKVVNFFPPAPYNTLRVRDEGHRITFTIKEKQKQIGDTRSYDIENEVNISNYAEMRIMLNKIGFKENYSLEKIREIYDIGESELVFDHYPGLPSFIEIESTSEEELFDLAKKLGLILGEKQMDAGDLYLEIYGITKDRPINIPLNFDSVYDLMKQYITKNEDQMLVIIDGQKKLLEKVDNK
jgi:predicted adenylyl cyclase CyaB